MLTRINNALMAGKRRVKVPYARFDQEVADALVKAGYLVSAEKKGRSVKKILDIEMRYEGEKPVISAIRLISKPSQRVYAGYRDIRQSKKGSGNYFITTPQGVLSDKEVRAKKVGGEVLCEIW